MAVARWLKRTPPETPPDAVGFDVAREGGDDSTNVPRWGKGADMLLRGYHEARMESAAAQALKRQAKRVEAILANGFFHGGVPAAPIENRTRRRSSAFEIAAPIPRVPPVTNATRAIVVPSPRFLFPPACRNIHGRDRPGHDDFRLRFLQCGARLAYRSTHIAMPMPPPMQRVARPFLASRFCISCSSVTRTRAPEAPIG